jgi:hypothetical protein
LQKYPMHESLKNFIIFFLNEGILEILTRFNSKS